MQAARGFSSQVQQSDSEKEEDASQQGEKKGRFFKFLQSAEKIDEEIKINPEKAKKVFTGEEEEEREETLMFDADEIEISLGEIATETPVDSTLLKDSAAAAEQDTKMPIIDEKLYAQIAKAQKKFNRRFFEKLAVTSSANARELTQLALEEKFESLSSEDKELFVLSMLNSTYELNDSIPNIELVFFKMFTSPLSTREARKKNDQDDLLAGNIFNEL